jgi:uncharacterized protein YggU (UPF0235/DUF167 family)
MYLKVKVTALAKKERISKISVDTFLISVREKAAGGAANARVCSILSGMYVVEGKKPRIRIVSGHTSPSKIISVDLAQTNERFPENSEGDI